MKLPFDSWDGRNDLAGTTEQVKLERYFGPAAVVFGSYQSAISSILEVLGSRTHLIPVVMPITASPDTVAATLRAGGDPLLLDILPQTLQMNPDELRAVLSEVQAAVVILSRPAGQPIDADLLAACGDCPTILDSRLPPHEALMAENTCTFSVFDLGPIVGSGAVVVHKFADQVRELKMVRNGLLGLAANLNDLLSACALKRFNEDPGLCKRRLAQGQVAHTYMSLLKEKLVLPFNDSPEWPYFVVRVDNADKVIAHLNSEVELVKPIFPLHMLSDVNRRWVEKPEYPVAEDLWRKLVALPTHTGILHKESSIVDKLLEVAHD